MRTSITLNEAEIAEAIDEWCAKRGLNRIGNVLLGADNDQTYEAKLDVEAIGFDKPSSNKPNPQR